MNVMVKSLIVKTISLQTQSVIFVLDRFTKSSDWLHTPQINFTPN